jgi:hypothetical protein
MLKVFAITAFCFYSVGAVAATNTFLQRGGTGENNKFDVYRYTITSPDSFEVLDGDSSISVLVESDPLTSIYPFLSRVGISSLVFELDAPEEQQIRTSYSRLNWSYQIIDAESQSIVDEVNGQSLRLDKEGLQGIGFGISSIAQQFRAYEMKFSFEFLAGYSLVPSLDPSCASVLCMTAVQDQLYFRYANPSAIPEPSRYALLFGGLAVLSIISLWRRREIS